jgi:hypothetical protein
MPLKVANQGQITTLLMPSDINIKEIKEPFDV